MKILHIINSLAAGGAEKLLLETLPLYYQKNIQVDLLILQDTNAPFLQELKKTNCGIIHTYGSGSVYNPIHIIRLIPFLRKYDVAHVHLFPAQYWVVLAKLISFSKIKLIFTEHNTSNRRLANRFFAKLDKQIYRFYDQIICITAEIRTILLQHTALPENRFLVIENGVNLSGIHNATAINWHTMLPSIQPSDKVLIQVAGFREQKDQNTLIKSLVHLPPHIKLVLVGEGVLKDTCENIVKDLGVQERVFFLGLRMDVPSLLKSADVIVLSSHYEGLSLSSIEGMAAGKPFVASAVPGLVEVVGGAGVLFPAGDHEQLAAEISKLLTNEKYYQDIVQSCQNKANEYDIHKLVHKHIKLYASVYQA